ncbi:6-phosphogluconolactonase [Motilibacter aurantiacus]|uniref:6-phosphogluconolactonase n=1 Tax=Motilibacter aurantiacus TaxID=2714955 RepID=UPI001409ECE1|nr:6-phosphogluconolactonase [Motilibacter aurantiacus]NHC45451.1 6-phosphogluconolactonase [Motilibacter aurantiacus]
MTGPSVVVAPDKEVLAAAIAARLITALADAQALRGTASVVLTGGGIGLGALRAVAASPALGAVDWSRVDFWWGDERYLPAGDPERNETGARSALLDVLEVSPARVHVMGAASPDGPEIAAEAYVAELATAAPEGSAVPAFDVCLLGVGPDSHVASLFPEHPGTQDTRPAFAVHGSPKPPPVRISLSFEAIRAAREVWLLVAGAEKADAVALALSGEAGERQVPAAGAYGTERTLWLLDAAAAGKLPR